MTYYLFYKYLLIGLIIFSIVFFIFGFAKINKDIDIENILKMYKEELKRVKSKVEYNNIKIKNLDAKILEYKKK